MRVTYKVITNIIIINPRRMRRRVTVLAFCQCVYMTVTTISARAFISKHKTSYHRLLCGVFFDLITRILPKRLCSGDMAIFASWNHHGQLFSTENTSLVLGTATVNLVHIALAIELTISIVELVFTLLTPWLLWQPCFVAAMALAYGHVFVSWLIGRLALCACALWSASFRSGFLLPSR
jgi:hypothetical protein